jgi:hypothetical protein
MVSAGKRLARSAPSGDPVHAAPASARPAGSRASLTVPRRPPGSQTGCPPGQARTGRRGATQTCCRAGRSGARRGDRQSPPIPPTAPPNSRGEHLSLLRGSRVPHDHAPRATDHSFWAPQQIHVEISTAAPNGGDACLSDRRPAVAMTPVPTATGDSAGTGRLRVAVVAAEHPSGLLCGWCSTEPSSLPRPAFRRRGQLGCDFRSGAFWRGGGLPYAGSALARHEAMKPSCGFPNGKRPFCLYVAGSCPYTDLWRSGFTRAR